MAYFPTLACYQEKDWGGQSTKIPSPTPPAPLTFCQLFSAFLAGVIVLCSWIRPLDQIYNKQSPSRTLHSHCASLSRSINDYRRTSRNWNHADSNADFTLTILHLDSLYGREKKRENKTLEFWQSQASKAKFNASQTELQVKIFRLTCHKWTFDE